MTTQAQYQAQANQNQAKQAKNDYVDLVTTGMGFINRPRWVQPKNGQPYLACSITAWYGKGGKEQQLFEVSVFGQAAEALDALFQGYPQVLDQNAGPKVTVTCGFSIGDGVPDGFNTQKHGYVKCIRGRLFKISWINVNGERFFTAQQAENGQAGNASQGAQYHQTVQNPQAQHHYAAPNAGYPNQPLEPQPNPAAQPYHAQQAQGHVNGQAEYRQQAQSNQQAAQHQTAPWVSKITKS